MAKIRTFARIKPAEDLYDDFETTRNRLYLRIPDSYGRDSTLYNRTRAPIVNHEFKYSQVFNTSTSQEEIFNVSAKGIIDGFLEGYNGTIFAYGQTSSGKTYTMQGDLADNTQKGLAPRSLTRIFDAVNARKAAGDNITVHCSFLEIYQEVGYDLLKTVNKNGPGPTTFSKVTVVDGPQGAALVKNLSIHAVNTEEAAQALLAQGELNRKVAETAMNNRSSRSHAVFTVYLSSRKGDLLIRSKMHFVDLAGSERVCKTGVKGLQLSEAKYINLSLHYLEGVIIALHQDATSSARSHVHTAPSGVSKSWSTMSKRPYSAASAADGSGRPRHIPYRNSLLTMLLKDSLGGNCLTTMIATISLELTNLSESISTCRFAQRVSCISNTARKNEEIDDKSMIKRLRTRVAELEAENNILKHGGQAELPEADDQEKASLTAEDRELCQHVVKDFLNGRLLDPIVAGVTDPFKFRECMSIFKRLIKDHNDKSIRLAEKLKQQPNHIQEAFYTGGRYHEAPLVKPSRRQQISFRDDSNTLTRNAYRDSSSRQNRVTQFKPTILKSGDQRVGRRVDQMPTEAWQLQLTDELISKKGEVKKKQVRIEVEPRSAPNTSQMVRPKPQSAAAALRRATTPFERKKNQEVTQLNKKVEANFAQQLEQTNHLKAFKKTIVEQEFEVAIQSLKRNLEITKHQLADQHAYTVKLRKQRSDDDDLVQQEKLVEGQLQKRVNKIEAELERVQNKLREIQSLDTTTSEHDKSPSYRSVSDKFSNMTKKDGRLDTVKVKTTLQQQQKLQGHMQKKIDEQRAIAINKQLEIKEMSTRQKLEEFKRKLAESREGKRPSTDQSSAIPQSTSLPQSTPHTPAKQNANDSRNAKPSKPSASEIKVQARSPSDVETKSHQKTFRHRIEREKPSGEQSIDQILSKYRTTGRDVKATRERTSQVNQILEKYRNEKKTTGKVVKSHHTSTNENSRPKSEHTRENSMSPISEKDSGYVSSRGSEPVGRVARDPMTYSRVKVPNSAMEYDAAHINRASDRQTRPDVGKQRKLSSSKQHNTHGIEADQKRQKDFEATLKSMLETKQGHHRRRTDAWVNSNVGQREPEKQDLFNVKLHQYLSKQYKKKLQNSGIQPQEKSKLRSATTGTIRGHHTDKTEDNRKPLVKHHETNSARMPRHSSGDRNKPFSHRMSHYQGKVNMTSLPANTVQHSEMSAMNDSQKSEDHGNSIMKDTSTTTNSHTGAVSEGSSAQHTPKVYNNLKKLTRHNEHASKIREIQTAATRIQRAWRRHRR